MVNWIGRRIFLVSLAVLLAACDSDLFVTQQIPAPVLVTLPVSTPHPGGLPPATPTQPEDDEPTPVPVTLIPTVPIPPSPVAEDLGIGATSLLWSWNEAAPPTTLAATGSRLAAIIADGRFIWLDADTGRLEGTALLWDGLLEGDSWGEIYTDGTVASVAARETSIDPSTGLASSRSRLILYAAEGTVSWQLPELDDPQHFYSTALAAGPGIVIAGKWPYGFADNSLAGYELFSGTQLWEISEFGLGYQQIVHDGTRMFILLNVPQGAAVGAFDLRTGEELWRWTDEEVKRPDRIALHGERVLVQTADGVIALDPISGEIDWQFEFQTATEAGLGLWNDLIYLAPAPTLETGFRPGVEGVSSGDGERLWQALNGLLADPIATGENVVWTIVKDFDEGQVWLSGLEPSTGLERVRILVGNDPNVLYQLVAQGQRVYVLGDTLQAYGY